MRPQLAHHLPAAGGVEMRGGLVGEADLLRERHGVELTASTEAQPFEQLGCLGKRDRLVAPRAPGVWGQSRASGLDRKSVV